MHNTVVRAAMRFRGSSTEENIDSKAGGGRGEDVKVIFGSYMDREDQKWVHQWNSSCLETRLDWDGLDT